MHAIARKAHTARFASTVTLLEAMESNNNRHEGVDGHCRRNDIATARRASLASTLTLLEAKDCKENWHERRDGHCRQNLVELANACEQHALLRAER